MALGASRAHVCVPVCVCVLVCVWPENLATAKYIGANRLANNMANAIRTLQEPVQNTSNQNWKALALGTQTESAATDSQFDNPLRGFNFATRIGINITATGPKQNNTPKSKPQERSICLTIRFWPKAIFRGPRFKWNKTYKTIAWAR